MFEDGLEENQGPDFNQLGNDLLHAAKANDTNKSIELIEMGAVIDAYQEKGWNPLHFASLYGNENLVKELLAKGAADRYLSIKSKYLGQKIENLIVSNNPLLWAAYKGHKNVCWLLLDVGYDPDDVDSVGNSALHLAASNNHLSVVQLLIRSGCNLLSENIYSHTAFDLATDDIVRETIYTAANDSQFEGKLNFNSLEKNKENDTASYSSNNFNKQFDTMKSKKQESNIELYKEAIMDLENILKDGKGSDRDITLLSAAITHGEITTVPTDLMKLAKLTLNKWEICHDLNDAVTKLENFEVVKTEDQYQELVNNVILLKAKADRFDDKCPVELGQRADDAVARGHAEYWLYKVLKSLLSIECASNKNLKAMGKLDQMIKRAKKCNAFPSLVDESETFLTRLTYEVELANAINNFPIVRLPLPPEEGPMGKDYWGPEDIGRINDQTENFPLPPPEDGIYQWIHSDAYIKLNKAYQGLKFALEEAQKYGVYEPLIEEAKIQEKKGSIQMKQLVEKDEVDHEAALVAVAKLAKKAKKKKK